MNLNVQVNLTQIHFQEYNHTDIVNLMGLVMGKGVYVKEQKNKQTLYSSASNQAGRFLCFSL